MNVSSENLQEVQDYSVSFRSSSGKKEWSSRDRRSSFGRRRGKGPVQFNGIHRRRQKKIRW